MDGSSEDMRNTGVMVNADGDFVIAKPDKAAWELYQEKAKASAAAAAEAAAAEYSKELQARGLECPIDKRMLLEPTRTPCCQRTYCNDCITNALIESDFVCPGCATEGVLLDNLSVDDQAVAKIKAYETEKAESKREKEKQQISNEDQSTNTNSAPGDAAVTIPGSTTPSQGTQGDSKKRPAEDELHSTATEESNGNTSSKKHKTDSAQTTGEIPTSQNQNHAGPSSTLPFSQQMPFPGLSFMQASGLPAMPFPDPGYVDDGMGFMNTPMGLNSTGNFPTTMDPAWNPMNSLGFNPLQGGPYGDPVSGAMHGGYGSTGMYNSVGDASGNMFPMSTMMGQNPGFPQGPGVGHFSNQQRTTFSTPYAREEDTAYFRQPVNPQRHQARHRRIRPSDYREL